MSASFSIAMRGFSAAEQRQLAQQIQLLQQGAASAVWSFVGEQAEAADLTLVRTERAADDRGGGSPSVGVLAETRVSITPIEWPLRLLSLRSLLSRVEADLQAAVAPTCGLERVAALTGATVLKNASRVVFIDPQQDLLLANVSRIREVQDILRRGDFSARAVDSANALDVRWAMHAPLRAMLWSMALELGPPPSEGFEEPGLAFHIGQWPMFGPWDSAPELVRLATVYSRQYATVAEGSEAALADRTTVLSFLYACRLTGLQLSVTRTRPPIPPSRDHEPARAGAQPVSKDWLDRLKLRLGLPPAARI